MLPREVEDEANRAESGGPQALVSGSMSRIVRALWIWSDFVDCAMIRHQTIYSPFFRCSCFRLNYYGLAMV